MTPLAAHEDVQKLLAYVTTRFGTDPTQWHQPDGYDSVALAVLDAIYSTSNNYTGVTNVISRYRTHREIEGADPGVDTATDLVETFGRWGGVDGFTVRTQNRWRTSPHHHAPRKAYAALEAAKVLAQHSLETVVEISAQLDSRTAREKSEIAKQWLAIPGQSSGLTWSYFLMLIGIPGVKADRMIIRFVTSALERKKQVFPKDASRLIEQVADIMEVNYSHLDHVIWRYQSGREWRQTKPGHVTESRAPTP